MGDRIRSARFAAVGATLAVTFGGFAGASVAPASAATFVVGKGASAVEVHRQRVRIDAWSSETLSATVSRPQGTVLAWTEVSRAKAHRRWRWQTYTAWCEGGRCSRPVRVFARERAVQRTPKDSATPWRVYVSADATRDRAVLKAGIRWGNQWAIASPKRLIGRGPTENVWNAGHISLTHTGDGHDWLAWNNDHQQLRISPVRNGRRLGGPVLGRGDTPQVRNVAGRWVMLSLGRTSDFEDESYPAKLQTATTIPGLRAAQPIVLAKLAQDGFLSLFGPDDGPLLAIWESITDVNHVRPVGNGAWIDRSGSLTPAQQLDDDLLVSPYLRAVTASPGTVALCPGGITGPVLGTLAQQATVACNDDEVRPVRLRQN